MFEGRDLARDPYAGPVLASDEGIARGMELSLLVSVPSGKPQQWPPDKGSGDGRGSRYDWVCGDAISLATGSGWTSITTAQT